MLLAGQDEKTVGLLNVTDALPGTIVKVGDYENNNSLVSYDDFAKLTLLVKNGFATFEDNKLVAGSEEVKVDKVIAGKIS